MKNKEEKIKEALRSVVKAAHIAEDYVRHLGLEDDTDPDSVVVRNPGV